MFKRVIELKFFSRAVSNIKKEIEIQWEAVQLTDGAGLKFEGNPNSNSISSWAAFSRAILCISYTVLLASASVHHSDFYKILSCTADPAQHTKYYWENC